MNILFLSGWYPSEPDAAVKVPVSEYARAARSAGASVRILQLDTRNDSGRLWKSVVTTATEGEIPVTRVVIHSRFDRGIYGTTPLMNLLVRRHYLEQVKPVFQPDLVHAHNSYQSGAMAWALWRMHDLPYLLSESDTDLDWYFGGGRFSYIPERVYREARKVLVPTGQAEERLRHHQPGLENLERIPGPHSPDGREREDWKRIYREALDD